MDSTKLLLVLSLGLVGLLYSIIWTTDSWTSSSSMTSIVPRDRLQEALEKASMENKTVIISIVNKAYTKETGLLDLFLESFQLGENTQFLRNHLLLAAIDQTAFDQCNLRRLHCYKLATEGVDFSAGEQLYMSDGYIKITWSKILFLTDVLTRGYNFIFTDMDVLWLRNPFTRLRHEREDLQISCDFYYGNSSDKGNAFNTGFFFVISNKKTIALFDAWYGARNESARLNDQQVLQRLIQKGPILQQLDLRVRFLHPFYFGGFCTSGRDFGKLVTMHANCCAFIDGKIEDLRAILDGWIKYFRGPSNNTSTIRLPNHNACRHDWVIDPNPN